MNKKHFIFTFIIICIPIIFYLSNWKDAGIVSALLPKTQTDCYAMIHDNINHKHRLINSMNNVFDVYFVQNMQPNDLFACCPYFPAIHINSKNETCTSWLQVIQTDSSLTKFNCFIDSHNEIFPLYTTGKDFYDFPQWNYSFLNKPLNYWLAHAYAVHIDQTNKTITCLGGIAWGFKLSYLYLQPQMILPIAVTKNNWMQDWNLYQEFFADYQMVIGA